MPARVIPNNYGNKKPAQKEITKVQTKVASVINDVKSDEIKKQMEAVLMQKAENISKSFSNNERAQFYAGHDRLDLQSPMVQRVRDLQEENDHLVREISTKEKELLESTDPLAILADIEHRKIIIARNTGEILKIYLRNEERINRLKELEKNNSRIQSDMMEMQGRFISTKDMEEKTKFASEFFLLKSEIERNLEEIKDLSK